MGAIATLAKVVRGRSFTRDHFFWHQHAWHILQHLVRGDHRTRHGVDGFRHELAQCHGRINRTVVRHGDSAGRAATTAEPAHADGHAHLRRLGRGFRNGNAARDIHATRAAAAANGLRHQAVRVAAVGDHQAIDAQRDVLAIARTATESTHADSGTTAALGREIEGARDVQATVATATPDGLRHDRGRVVALRGHAIKHIGHRDMADDDARITATGAKAADAHAQVSTGA